MKEALQAFVARAPEIAKAMDRLSNAVERREESDNRLRQEFSDLHHTMEDFRYEVRHELQQIGKAQAVALQQVTNVQHAVGAGAKKEESAWVAIVKAILAAPTTKVVLILIVLGLLGLLALSEGWLKSS